jgi:hypothetical protein
MMASWRTVLYRVSCPVAAALLALAFADAATGAGKDNGKKDSGPVTIRLDFKPGQMYRYNLQLSGQTAWTPQVPGADWGQMATDFTFILRAKTMRPDGSCTFDLFGEALQCAGQTAGGRIQVAANRQKARLEARGKGSLGLSSDDSPLAKPMTLTLGPRGDIRFGTGLLPIAIYMLPQVNHLFWTLLTTAPEKPLKPDDQWEVQFSLPLPGVAGKPLDVTARWKVLGWKKYGSQDVLAVGLAAALNLKDARVILMNGDEVRLVQGTYEASGQSHWDVEHGVLCTAMANQDIFLAADVPIARALRSNGKCALRLLGSEKP